ncbi:MAG: DUF4082 domain-containing protein [Methylobacter sp.]
MKARLLAFFILFSTMHIMVPVSASAASYSIWPNPVTPGFSYNNPRPIELGLKFRSDVGGNVTGVRFFKASGATGTHTGRLRTAGGALLAEIAFTNETASGWQTQAFTTPVAIQPNTTYIISYYLADGNRRFSDTYDYFVAAGINNGPLHALRAGVDGPNGVFSDTGGLLTQNYRSSNYWVDLVFDDNPVVDTTPPSVSVVIPGDGAFDVAVAANVTLTFSEAMDGSTINASTIQLLDPSNNIITTTVSYNSSTFVATLDPTVNLNPSITYTIRLPAGGVKDQAGNALAAVYNSSFTTAEQDIIPPTVTSVKPIDGVFRLRLATNATVYFSEAMNQNTVNAQTFELRDAFDNPVPAIFTYNNADNSVTLDPLSDLDHSSIYTARVKGGQDGVKDLAGNALIFDFTWSFSTVSPLPPVDQAPGGPILVISSVENLFTRYYIEILRTEGFNEFDNIDISQLTPQALAGHDVVIIGDQLLTIEQVTTLTDWVDSGGQLIAMRPDKKLAGLLGLNDLSSTLSDSYLAIDTSSAPGAGIVSQTLQFHGAADQYNLGDATALATLYSSAATATPYPAVTLRSVGSNGGQAAAFTFDLARSIVYTHQGNPAWQINHVNPLQTYGTALDLYYDVSLPWIDFTRISIPQADEQQRFLANLILYMNSNKMPLPRFWYFPKGKKAVIVLTGDDHLTRAAASGSTDQFFARHEAQSPAGCSVADWECVRSSSYIDIGLPGVSLANIPTDAQAAEYTAKGFEIGVHADAGMISGVWCGTWPSDMSAQYAQQLNRFMRHYASIPVQGSERSHCYSWFGYTGDASWHGYSGEPEVEANLSMRLDTNISYNPKQWATVYPGYQMGSAMMMRFAQVDTIGKMTAFLDIYNGGTQITDDNSGQSASSTRSIVDSFLDAAIGPQGYYGGFVVNMHSDNWYGWSYDGSDQVVASAQARGVPIVSGQQMADWLDGRNSSSFGSISWDGTTLGFNVTVDANARNLQAMLPIRNGNKILSEINRGGNSVSFTKQIIKGIEYAFFPVLTDTYAATYIADTTMPIVNAVVPADGATDVNNGINVSVTFSEEMDSATINSSTIQLQDPASNIIPISVNYNASTLTATLDPTLNLNPATTYTVLLPAGGVNDLAGNALDSTYTSSFTTATIAAPYSIWPNPVTPGFSYNNPRPIELGLKFRSDVGGDVTGVRFFKADGATGTHIGRLRTAGGTLLAEIAFTNETASGWQTQAFTAPIAIQPNTTYIISYYLADGNRRFSDTYDYFIATGVSNGPLHALQAGVDGPNGVYSDTGGLLTKNYRSSNYWVDLVFQGG